MFFICPDTLVPISNQSGCQPNFLTDFLSIKPDTFLVRVIKKPENGEDALIIRIIETSNKKATGTITLNREIKDVKLIDLIEKPIKNIEIQEGKSFSFQANSQEILTFYVRF